MNEDIPPECRMEGLGLPPQDRTGRADWSTLCKTHLGALSLEKRQMLSGSRTEMEPKVTSLKLPRHKEMLGMASLQRVGHKVVGWKLHRPGGPQSKISYKMQTCSGDPGDLEQADAGEKG